MTRDSTKGRWYVFLMFVWKARLIVAIAAGIALFGEASWGDDQSSDLPPEVNQAMEAFNAGDYRDAFLAAERPAREGHVIAQIMLGWLYWKGRGTDPDFALAAEWLTRAAEQGHPRAMTHLADLHFYDYMSLNNGRLKDRPLAAEWYRRAAEAGHRYGQYRFGTVLIRRQGIDRDREAGVAWMRKAIDAGERRAMHSLGYMYESGELGEQDFEEALQLYRRAIRHGVQQSARQAIEMLRDEMSPVFDLEEAYFWALIARQWWPDDPTNGLYFISVAETVHRVDPQAVAPPDYAHVTLGIIDEETYRERLRAHNEARHNPETWPYRLDEAARRRSEETANAIISNWPEPPSRDEVVED